MKKIICVLISATTMLSSCFKSGGSLAGLFTSMPPSNLIYSTPVNPRAILIDASKDGGGWWFPQSPTTGFSSINPHQGKALVDYLQNLGYQVNELPRGATITTDLLNSYSKVIRPTAFYPYTPEEIAAYNSFLNRSSSLLLISDHMQNTTNDLLSTSLGLVFEGEYWGPITSFQSHSITNNVSSLDYIAGSVIKSWDHQKITMLGYLNSQGTTFGAMGIVNHPFSRIFFIGDVNGIEAMPQPFTSNLFNWWLQ